MLNSTYEAVGCSKDEQKRRQHENGNPKEKKKDVKLLPAIKNMKPKSVWHERHFIKDAYTSFKRSL